MTRTEQLKFCKKCTNQKFNPSKGIICSLTDDVADFTDSCENYQKNELMIEKEQAAFSELRDNSKRSKLAINIFIGICIVNVLAVISGYFEVELLERIAKGEQYYTMEETTLNDLRQGIVGLMQSALYICSIIFFLQWFRRAYWNLHQYSEFKPEHNENMAVWGFAIPFVNLYRPVSITKEITSGIKSKLLEEDSNHSSSINESIIGLWWALWIIGSFISNFALKTLFKDDTIEQIITSSTAYLFSDGLDIITAVITAIMISQISKDENLLYAKVMAK